jgi:hypothetical protein
VTNDSGRGDAEGAGDSEEPGTDSSDTSDDSAAKPGSGAAAGLSFRYPERLGPFNVWIDESVYPQREQALAACRQYAKLLEERRVALGPGAGPRQVADDEVYAAASAVLHALDALWEKIRGQSGLAILGGSSLARQLVLASTVEWALEIIYQIQRAECEEAGPGRKRWRVTGRAWRRDEVSWSGEGLSGAYDQDDATMAELALLEACARAYARCMATHLGWNELADEGPAGQAHSGDQR